MNEHLQSTAFFPLWLEIIVVCIDVSKHRFISRKCLRIEVKSSDTCMQGAGLLRQ